jgi:hypothetical protein
MKVMIKEICNILPVSSGQVPGCSDIQMRYGARRPNNLVTAGLTNIDISMTSLGASRWFTAIETNIHKMNSDVFVLDGFFISWWITESIHFALQLTVWSVWGYDFIVKRRIINGILDRQFYHLFLIWLSNRTGPSLIPRWRYTSYTVWLMCTSSRIGFSPNFIPDEHN